MTNYHNSIEEAMLAVGFPYYSVPPDGQIHRFGENKRYWAINNGDYGVFGDWSKGQKEVWTKDGYSLSKEEREYIECGVAEEREYRKKKDVAKQKEVAVKAELRWKNAKPAVDMDSHPYLSKKQIKPYDVRLDGETLIIPLYDISGKLWSLQTIDVEGNKRFLSGGRKKSCFFPIGLLDGAEKIYICEGLATGASIYEVMGLAVVVSFDAGNMEPVTAEICAAHPNAAIVLCGDNDQWKEHNTGKKTAEAVANKYGCKVVLPRFDVRHHDQQPTDFNDLHVLEGPEETEKQLQLQGKKLSTLSLQELLAIDVKPTESLLHPIIPRQGLVMLYAYRGLGKTYFSMEIAYALATGGNFLRWKTEKPRKVLFVDGEMTLSSMQERFARMVKARKVVPPSQTSLRFISQDVQERGIPSLHTEEGQKAIEEQLEGVDLLILDNISTLYRNGRENEAESWNVIQEWALKLRRMGVSILFIHHAGKNGEQRGTAKREDVLDCVIALKKPKDYESSQGVRVEVHYDKHRHFAGKDAEAFEAQMTMEDGMPCWEMRSLEENLMEQALRLAEEGKTQRDIADALGTSASKVNRLLRKAKEAGIYGE